MSPKTRGRKLIQTPRRGEAIKREDRCFSFFLLLSIFARKGREQEREREMNKNSRLSLYSLRFFLFRAIEKNTPRQLWIPDELQIELNRHRVNTFTYLLRLFTRWFSKGSAHLFFPLFLYFSLSLVRPRMNIKELRGGGKSGFRGGEEDIDFHRVGPNIVANSLVTVFSYYHDELVRRWMVDGMDEYWTNDKGLIKAGPNVECIASLSFHHVSTIFRFQSLYSFSTCFIVCYWNNEREMNEQHGFQENCTRTRDH